MATETTKLLEEFFKGLNESLTKALSELEASSSEEASAPTPSQEEQTKKSLEAKVAELAEQVEKIAKALSPDGEIATAVKKSVEDSEAHADVLAKMLERLERVEASTAVTKAIAADDFEETDKSEPVTKGKAKRESFDSVFAALNKRPMGTPIILG